MKDFFPKTATFAWLALNLVVVCAARGGEIDYQAHYLYLGEDPNDIRTLWTSGEMGLGHSDTHWFITQRGHFRAPSIWRVPVSQDLGSLDVNTPGVSQRGIPAELFSQGYRWFGEPCIYRFNGTDYLLVPMGSDLFVPQWYRLAVFRGDESLAFIGVAPFGGSSWCGVDVVGAIYGSGEQDVSTWRRYSVNWPMLAQGGILSLQLAGTRTLYRENGVDVETLPWVLSGEVTANGELLYLLTLSDTYRFHVFDMSSGRLVRRSTAGYGPFNLERPEYHFPSGFTIWDLEGTDSPHQGQLHLQVYNNDPDSDIGAAVKHYTRTIRVDAASGGAQNGTPESPFHTIAGALNLAWDGSEIRIQSNDYPETPIIDQRVRMTAEGGVVRIGN